MSSALALFLAFVAALPAWLAIALKVGVVIGLIGSLVEEVGKRFNLPRLAAVGQQIEAVAVDVPKLVSRVQGWDLPGLAAKFRKAPPALLLCIGLAFAAPLNGCANLKPALSSAQVPQDIAIAFKAAGVALAIADTATAAYADSVKDPTQDQVDKVDAVVVKLQDVKSKLDSVQADLNHGRDRLRAALEDLNELRSLLALAGVKVPSSIAKALEEAGRVLQ
jgi:hypothetical protein